MRRKRELMAVAVVAAIVAAVLLVFPMINARLETAPVKREEQQNSGSDAPAEQLPPAGTTDTNPGG